MELTVQKFFSGQTLDANQIRQTILMNLHQAGGGHYGGALSVTDILVVLYNKFLNITENKATKFSADRLILSKGHAAIALYAVLAAKNIIKEQNLSCYGKYEARLEGHPDMTKTPGIDFSTGSLGQGLSVGLGMALKLKEKKSNVWVVLGDGECQEGQVWEAALLASRLRIDNLHVVVDENGAQEWGYKHKPHLDQEPLPLSVEKWQAFGWHVQTVNGHDHSALEAAFRRATQNSGQPSVILARTKKGAGIRSFEADPEKFHCITLTEKEYQTASKELQQWKN